MLILIMKFLDNLNKKIFLNRHKKSIAKFIQIAKAYNFDITNGDERKEFLKFTEFRKNLFLDKNNTFDLGTLSLMSDLSSHYLGYLIEETVKGNFGLLLDKQKNLIIVDTEHGIDLQLNLFRLFYFYYKGDYSVERIKSIINLLDKISIKDVTKDNIEEYMKNNISL